MKKTVPISKHDEIIDALSLKELCLFCDIQTNWVIEMVDQGVLEPQGAQIDEWYFHGINILRAKKAGRLSRDLGINLSGIAMVLDLLEERDQLIRRLRRYEVDT